MSYQKLDIINKLAQEEKEEHEADLRKKNEKLLGMMKKIEDDKPKEGWGFTKKTAGPELGGREEF